MAEPMLAGMGAAVGAGLEHVVKTYLRYLSTPENRKSMEEFESWKTLRFEKFDMVPSHQIFKIDEEGFQIFLQKMKCQFPESKQIQKLDIEMMKRVRWHLMDFGSSSYEDDKVQITIGHLCWSRPDNSEEYIIAQVHTTLDFQIKNGWCEKVMSKLCCQEGLSNQELKTTIKVAMADKQMRTLAAVFHIREDIECDIFTTSKPKPGTTSKPKPETTSKPKPEFEPDLNDDPLHGVGLPTSKPEPEPELDGMFEDLLIF